MPVGLYIHIPFCLKKCHYCDFPSYATFSEKDKINYINALRKEMGKAASRNVNTVYIGGGTPTSLSAEQIGDILKMVKNCFETLPDAEFTIEANPGTIDTKKLKVLKDLGVNRLSLGVQSLNKTTLRRLGRIHTNEDFRRSYKMSRQAGFKNINLDFIYGLPGQTLVSWKKTLKAVIELKPEHISAYSLSIEQGTRFFQLNESGRLKLPGEDAEAKMYEMAIEYLAGAGYRHYEISNFCCPGYECRHNQIYWNNDEYLGFGAGAHSYFQGLRWGNSPWPPDYIAMVNSGFSPAADWERLPLERKMRETAVLGLRLCEGIDLEKWRKRFAREIAETFGEEIRQLKDEGLIELDQKRLKLSKRGLLMANEVWRRLI